MSENALRPVLRDLSFTEAPRWREGRLWFSDFYTHRVLAVDPAGRLETIVTVPSQPSGLGWRPDGTLLIVSMLDRKLMRLAEGRLVQVADLSGFATGPCNDMVVDRSGRAFIGNFGFDRHKGEAERTATLMRVEPDGQVAAAATDMMFPNGSVITPDGARLIVAETMGQRLTRFDLSADGQLTGRSVFADLTGHFPDGICLDAEGAIWVADARGSDLLRVREGGAIVQRIALPAGRHAFACTLGGEDRRDLYVCTASGSGPVAAQRRDAGIDVVRVEVPGAGVP
ncbi:MAG TPA: SMP-30/gluconolactonase/LRE family protein [Burkholderiaceae bacterium]|nr:SMP-30/gluconolactonase/LRE family protein [Burkholderiaceae bacterium]